MKIQPFPFAIGLAIGTLLFILMVGAGAFGAETGPAKCYPVQIGGLSLECDKSAHEHENKASKRAPVKEPETPDDDDEGGCEAARSGR